MSQKEIHYETFLTPEVIIRVSFLKHRGRILRFTVQLECFIQSEWHPIVRYDTAHGFAHRDILHPDGTEEKTPLPFSDYNEALTFAQLDIKLNWQKYRRRYERWLK